MTTTCQPKAHIARPQSKVEAMTETRSPKTTSILDVRKEFSKARIWPAQPIEIDPTGWLGNFDDEDVDVAVALLESFVFFNDAMTKTLLESALASLAAQDNFSGDPEMWASFLRRTLISFPTGEDPSPTDSGYIFARMARQHFGFAENQIVDPPTAVKRIEESQSPLPIIFVDDVVGSGDQLISTWRREYPNRNRAYVSLEDQWNDGAIESAHVVAPIVTWMAKARLAEDFPYFKIGKAHLLTREYSATNENTVLVPEELRGDLLAVISKYADRINKTPEEALGHGRLALNIAFEHSFPDLSLPMLWAESEDWKPLRRRS